MVKYSVTRVLVVLLVVLVSAPVFMGSVQAADTVLTITHNWGPDDSKGPILQSIFDDFKMANPGVDIEVTITPDTDIPTVVETAFLGGVETDLVFQNYLGPTTEWVADGVAVPVSDYIERWGLAEKFVDVALEQFTGPDGKVAAFPLEGFNWPIWYNTAIFQEAGVEIPKTVDELIVAAEKIRAAGYQPFAIGGSDWTGFRFFQMLVASGVTMEEAKKLFSEGGFAGNERAVKTVETFIKMRDAGVFADNVEGLEFNTMNELFFSGKAAMMHGGSWSYAELPEALQKDVVVGGFPKFAHSPYPNPTAWAGYTAKGIWITRNGAKKMDVIEKFITFFYQPQMIARFVEQSGMVPPLADVPVDESKLNPLFVQSLSLPKTTSFPLLGELATPPAAAEALNRAGSDAFVPDTGAADILKALDEAFDF